ncbi:hypothetical protein JHK85_040248 [Glycine max]|nr:hypothetical protein JHK85_040248 [Glycine max]
MGSITQIQGSCLDNVPVHVISMETVLMEGSGATQDGGERSPRGCEKINSLKETNGQGQIDLPESAKFLVVTHSTAPKTNLQVVPMMVKGESGDNVALYDSELLSLEMGWDLMESCSSGGKLRVPLVKPDDDSMDAKFVALVSKHVQ